MIVLGAPAGGVGWLFPRHQLIAYGVASAFLMLMFFPLIHLLDVTMGLGMAAMFGVVEAMALANALEPQISAETRTPRLPDADRLWYSIGATWAFSDALELNFGYARLEPKDPEVDSHDNQGHRLTGPFDGYANLLAFSAQYKF